MAYMSPEHKAKLAPAIKDIFKKYGVKGSISVRHHSTLVVTIKSGKIDFISSFNKVAKEHYRGLNAFTPATNNIAVNEYWYNEHFDGEAVAFLDELIPAMKGPEFFDHSDAQTDYFHTSHYYDVKIGAWDKPYILEA